MRILIFLNGLLFCTSLFASKIVIGDDASSAATFSFSVKHFSYLALNDYLLCAADASMNGLDQAKDFAVSLFLPESLKFQPLAPVKTTMNITSVQQDNPLYDAGFTALTTMFSFGQRLPVCLKKDDTRVFMFESLQTDPASIVVSNAICDASGTEGVSIKQLAADDNGHIFTYVDADTSVAGNTGSGIAVILRGIKKVEETQIRFFQQVNALTGAVDSIRAQPCDIHSSFLQFNNNVLAFLNCKVMFWDAELERLYVGFQGISGAESDGGVRTVCVGRIEGHKLVLDELVTEAVFDASHNDLLIGKKGQSVETGIIDLTVMHTTGNTSYLVVRGLGNTVADIRVFPLVQSSIAADQGKIASKNSSVDKVFVEGIKDIQYHQKTVVPSVAQLPGDLFLSTDKAAKVGRNVLLPGTILSMWTEGDTVCVTIENDGDPKFNGIWRTQAVIDGSGKIIGWTDWQAVLLQEEPIVFFATNPKTGNSLFATTINGGTKTLIRKTEWLSALSENSTMTAVGKFIQKYHADLESNIQKTVVLQSSLPGMVTGDVCAVLGNSSIVLYRLNTRDQVSGALFPLQADDFSSFDVYAEGRIDQSIVSNVIAMHGGVLSEIGLLTDVVITYDSSSQNAWLTVSGTAGIAVLADDNGNGWNSATGIGTTFSGIHVPMSFKKISDQPTLKLASSDGFLFCLNNNVLNRMELNPHAINTGNFNPVRLAEKDSLVFDRSVFFTELFINGPLVLLGTTAGLFQNRINTSASTMQEGEFTSLLLPEAVQSINSINSSDSLLTDSFGVIYVVSSDFSLNTSRINRLFLNTNGTLVNQAMVSVFTDGRLQSTLSHLLDFGTKVRFCKTNGYLWLNSLVRELFFIAPQLVSGYNQFLGLTHHLLPLTLTPEVTGLFAIKGHGGWLITDSSTMYVNQ